MATNDDTGRGPGRRDGWEARLSRLRPRVVGIALRALCVASELTIRAPNPHHLWRTRILSGPLSGRIFAMPRLERAAFALGTYERDVVATISRYVPPGSVAYDVGAHAGYMTLLLSRLVGPDGSVVAIEPNEAGLTALRANVEYNELRNVDVVAEAASDATGSVTFARYEYSLVGHIHHPGAGADADLVEVPSVTLDDLVFERGHPPPVFVKIDAEGSEERVLKGSARLLRDVRPVVLVEVRSGWMWDHVSAIMRDHRYQPRFVAGDDALDRDHFADVLFLPA